MNQLVRDLFAGKFIEDPISGCWNWTRGKCSYGYGYVWHDRKVRKVTRIVASLCGMQIDGLGVCHKCDNPACINPEHLFPGTHADNMKDAYRKGRNAKGEKHGQTKISTQQVREISELHKAGLSQRKIAALFGLCHSGVQHILQKRKDEWLGQ